MPTIPLGLNDWGSTSENIPRIQLHNMYIAEDPASPDGKTRLTRPSLKIEQIMPRPTCTGIYALNGALGSGSVGSGTSLEALAIYGNILYRIKDLGGTNVVTAIGSIPSIGGCQFAGTYNRVIVASSGIAYSTDGSTVTTVPLPDGHLVQSVATIYGYFLLASSDNTDGNRFYWISPGGVNPDPLDFASAERYPDPIISINVINDEIWLIGSTSIEVWQATGSSTAPFQRIVGRDYNDGCLVRDTIVTTSYNNYPALMWMSSTGSVVLAQGGIKRVSNEAVEELLRTIKPDNDNIRAYSFRNHRHDFYVLTAPDDIPNGFTGFTLAYDLTTGSWARWDTNGENTWDAYLGCQAGNMVVVGNAGGPFLWSLEDGPTDAGLPIIRDVTGTVFNTGVPYPCADVTVKVNSGYGSVDSNIQMRFSDDLGQTWSSYITTSVGGPGLYNTKVTFKSLGLIDSPGRMFEFRYAGIQKFRLDYATMNEASN